MNFAPQHTRILIVDDTLQSIQVLGTTLKKEGYQLNAAQNGQQALKLAQKTLPDLILLDIMMPEMDEFEVCQHLKADDKTCHIPVVFLSAKAETQDMVKEFELGSIDYITKPFNTVELLKRVETHLELAMLRTDRQKQVAEKTAQLEVEHGERLRAEKQLAQMQRLEADIDYILAELPRAL
jgi:two-component system, sensor histidine kinase and response regulator